jgi:hypothetical protein
MNHASPGSIPGQDMWNLGRVLSELPRVHCGIEVKNYKIFIFQETEK